MEEKKEKTYGQALQEGLNIINSGDESNEKCLSNSFEKSKQYITKIVFTIPIIKPDKFSIDGHNDIRIKKAGFNLTQNDDSRKIMKEICEIIIKEKSQKETKMEDFFKKGFTKVELNKILDDIKIDIGDFVNSKKEYRDAKNNIEIAYECLSSIIFDLGSIIGEAIQNLEPEKASKKFDLNSIIDEANLNLKLKEASEKIVSWNSKINDIRSIKWNNQNSFSLKKLNSDIIERLEYYIQVIESNLSTVSIESLRSLFVTLSNLVRDYMKQAVQVLSEIAQDNQKFYYKAAIGLKKLKEKIKLCKEYMDKAANEYLIDNINLEYKYLITKEKNEKEEKSKVYTKFFKKLEMKDILKISNTSDEFYQGYDKGYTFSKKKDEDKKDKDNDLSLEFKFEEIFGVKKFSDWTPDINDIKQGSVGDCYLLAALQSLCQNINGRQAIQSCFVNGETIESDNFVEIRLYKLKLTAQDKSNYLCAKPYQEIIVKMSTKRLSELSYYNQGKIWVTFFERAFAYYRNNLANVVLDSDLNSSKTCNSEIITKAKQIIDGWYNKLSYKLALENVDSGYEFIALSAITGKESFAFVGGDTTTPKELDNILLKNKNIALDFKAAQINKLKIKESGLYSSHAYSIIAIAESMLPAAIQKLKDNTIITLKNPHNVDYYLDFSGFEKFDKIASLKENEYENCKHECKEGENEKRGEIQMQYCVLKEILSEVNFGNSFKISK